MIPEQLFNLGSRALRLFRVFGKFEFVKRLHDFLLHEGRLSRAQTLEQTAKAVLDLEKAESLRIENSRALLELMTAAGFSEEQIRAALSNPLEMHRVSVALTTMLKYVNDGVVTISMVQAQEPQDVSAVGIRRLVSSTHKSKTPRGKSEKK